MNIHIISLFPEMFAALTDHGVVGRAIKRDVLRLSLLNPRDYAKDDRKTVDDRPYGGGPGMVLMAEPLSQAIAVAREQQFVDLEGQQVSQNGAKVIYLSPQGERFDHRAASAMAEQESLILLAGRYEGVDERLLESEVDEEWSIGDFVLSGGELAAMVMIDAIARLLPRGLGNEHSADQDSFADGLLDCPHYTRPEVYRGQVVPEVLKSGDHQAIAKWRAKQALGRTWLRRPDLLNKADLNEEQKQLLEQFKREL